MLFIQITLHLSPNPMMVSADYFDGVNKQDI